MASSLTGQAGILPAEGAPVVRVVQPGRLLDTSGAKPGAKPELRRRTGDSTASFRLRPCLKRLTDYAVDFRYPGIGRNKTGCEERNRRLQVRAKGSSFGPAPVSFLTRRRLVVHTNDRHRASRRRRRAQWAQQPSSHTASCTGTNFGNALAATPGENLGQFPGAA